MENAIHQRASDKAFAKMTNLTFEIAKLKKDIQTKNTGGITMEELTLIYTGTKIELKVWNYIAGLIEKSDKL